MAGHRVPRGVLREQRAGETFELSRHEPGTALHPFVQYYWIVRWDLRGRPPYRQRVLPNLSVHAAFSRHASGVFGPGKGNFEYLLHGRDQVLGVRFRPGCFRPFLGRPVSTIAGTSVRLAEVLGPAADGTQEAILAADNTTDMAGLADALLSARVPELTATARRAIGLVETIAADPAITRVDRLSGVAGISVRTLQRTFDNHVGVSPKWAIRVYRLNDAAQRVARAGATEAIDYAALAAELGYSDQAHFTRDFTATVGSPPATYGRE
ncbi:helix-turn-helix domain-containing protein [Amycolatopsis cihanbeyliensis]|uniref:AraC-like DNA-binding protein n=1 Tax=Amycolatopsis cihanbeyliensis TaxID=1128664 RepID=A0A542DNH5_AMYCI|nr:helix-turn-helix domain-containing protein [Amycolatopsis cihanbeyliensis]TQJ04524.1 AraC-like DNA-binding protein [Amycolatopsis cihanbeyliensis]